MSEEDKQKAEEVGKEVTAGTENDGAKSQTVKDTERLRAETAELEKAIAEKANADARAKIGGITEAGQSVEKKEETPHEYRIRINKELATGKTEFGN